MTALRSRWKNNKKRWFRTIESRKPWWPLWSNHCQWDQNQRQLEPAEKRTWKKLHSPGYHIMHWRVRKKMVIFKNSLCSCFHAATCSRGWAPRDLRRWCRSGASQTLICTLITMDPTKLQILIQLVQGEIRNLHFYQILRWLQYCWHLWTTLRVARI